MDLAVVAKLKVQLDSIIESFSSHDGLRTNRVRDASLGREIVQELYGFKDDVDRHKFRNPIEGEAVSGGPGSLLHYPDASFNFRDVLTCTSQVDLGSTWH